MTKITVDKDLIEQAINAAFSPYCTQDLAILVPVLRAALAEPAVEPVAWRVHPATYGVGHDGVYALTTRTEQVDAWRRKGWDVEPLYTSPPPPAEVPLTTEEYTALAHRIASKYAHRSDPRHIAYTFLPSTLEQFVRAIEQAVRQKAGLK